MTTEYTFLVDALRANDFGEGCAHWPYDKLAHGFGVVDIPGGSDFALAHRVALEFSVGPSTVDNCIAMHSCNSRDCFNPTHLTWGSLQDFNDEMDLGYEPYKF